MNRALLERLNTYQPRPGIAARPPSAFNVAFWALAVCLVALVVLSVLALVNCAPAAQGMYTGELTRCVDQARTLAESKECRAGVNERWHVDAGGD